MSDMDRAVAMWVAAYDMAERRRLRGTGWLKLCQGMTITAVKLSCGRGRLMAELTKRGLISWAF